MKKIIISLLSAAFVLCNIFPVQAQTVTDEIEIVYENSYVSKYIYELDKEYTIILDRVNEYYIVDDSIYTFDSFLSASSVNPDNPLIVLLEENPLMINNVDYDAEYLRYESYETQTHTCNTNTSGISTFCVSCGIGTTVPKDNYKDDGYVLTINKIDDVSPLVFSNSGTFAQQLAAIFKITIADAIAIRTNLIAIGFIAGMYLIGDRTVKQYFHNICPKAIKEEQLIYIGEKDGKKAYNVTETRYFFNANPY